MGIDESDVDRPHMAIDANSPKATIVEPGLDVIRFWARARGWVDPFVDPHAIGNPFCCGRLGYLALIAERVAGGLAIKPSVVRIASGVHKADPRQGRRAPVPTKLTSRRICDGAEMHGFVFDVGLKSDVPEIPLTDDSIIEKHVVVIGRIHHPAQGQLSQIGCARRLFGGGFRLGEDGKEDGGENRDDRNHHQEFDERKRAPHGAL